MRRISQHKEEQVFEMLRNIPAELSQQNVGKMLEAFPLPVESKHWFYRFHLNSILLLIGIFGLLVGSSLLYSGEQKNVLSSFPINTTTIPIETKENTSQKEIHLPTLENPKTNLVLAKKIKSREQNEETPTAENQKTNNPNSDEYAMVNIQSDLELVLQKSLDSNHLERILEKDANGFFRPLTLVTNHHFFKKVNLNHGGQKVNIVYSKDTTGIENAYVGITKLDIKKEKALLEFQYKGALVRVALIKKESKTSPGGTGEWTYRSIEIKGQPVGVKMWEGVYERQKNIL